MDLTNKENDFNEQDKNNSLSITPPNLTWHGLEGPKRDGACIVIMGVTAAGKSTTGKFLSERIGFSFQDADVYHPEENMRTMQSGKSLTDEQRARFVEILLEQISQRTRNGENIVLAWSALKDIHRKKFQDAVPQSVFVFLEISENDAIARAESRRKVDITAVDPLIVNNQFLALEFSEDALVIQTDQPLEDILNTIIGSSEIRSFIQNQEPSQ